ncbi:MAG TPA: FAD:protein FMN transferase [Solirubrobacteraceae bacterium]|nr:FAD:protein FMN transferase [Solirubrobacteraceae bacterium]
MSGLEASEEFECFGARCLALVTGSGRAGSAYEAAALSRDTLLAWHTRFSRFLRGSELSRLNADARRTVPVRPLMAHFARAVRDAGTLTRGLVDATLVREIELAGYREDLRGSLALADALALAPPRRPAAASAARRWRAIDVDLDARTVTRPPGVRLDSGGLAKGLFADTLGATLATHASFAVNCAGDLLLGGTAGTSRQVKVESPFDGHTLHTFELAAGGVATSGIGRRSWLDADGAPAHHLLDPASGRPAFTGVVQVTALGPTALAAEIKAKAALLSGPERAPQWLAQGGVIVFDDGSQRVLEPPPTVTLAQLSAFARAR